MTSQTSGGSLSRAAKYAQLRRNNEAEAREVLSKRLPAEAFRPDFSTRGEFNLTTKTLLATLLLLDPHANIPEAPRLDASTVEYNQQRRANETSVRETLESIIPTSLFTSEITDRTDFNKTTKVMIAADHRVRELLPEREDTDSSSSTLSDPEVIGSAVHHSTIDQYEVQPREERRSLRIQKSSSIPQKQALASPEQTTALEPNQHTPYGKKLEDVHQSILTRFNDFPSAMSPSTRSFSSRKRRAVSRNFESSTPEKPPSDDTITAPSRSPEENDLLVNLRADELDQEMNLDAKPPPLPKKAFENQGYWQIKPRETTQHSSVYVRALEQAADRLVAKAKELVTMYDGNDTACQKPLIEAQEWCVDTIDMLAGEVNSKSYTKKWNARRKVWENREDYKSKFDE